MYSKQQQQHYRSCTARGAGRAREKYRCLPRARADVIYDATTRVVHKTVYYSDYSDFGYTGIAYSNIDTYTMGFGRKTCRVERRTIR